MIYYHESHFVSEVTKLFPMRYLSQHSKIVFEVFHLEWMLAYFGITSPNLAGKCILQITFIDFPLIT